MATSQKTNEENKVAEKLTQETKAGSVDQKRKLDGKKKQEAVYTLEEFAANAKALFGVSPECVQAAFREKGITECSKDEAKQTVESFLKKEVK